MVAKNPFLERWDTPEGRDARWAALLWLMHGGDRPAGFGTTDEGRLDLRGLVVPEPVELADIVVPSAVPGHTMTFTQTSGQMAVRGREWADVDLSYSWLPSLDVEESQWVNCRFDAAVLRDSRIWDTEVENCSFETVDFRNVAVGTSLHSARETWWRHVSFRKAVVTSDVYFSGWHAEDVSFEGARISSVQFAQVTLVRVVFDGKLRKVQFNNRVADLRPSPGPLVDCDFSRCEFDDVGFKNIHLTNVSFPPGTVVVGNAIPVSQFALSLLPEDGAEETAFARTLLTKSPLVSGSDDLGAQLFTRRDLDEGDPTDPFAMAVFNVLEEAAARLGTPILLDGGVFVGPPAPVPGGARGGGTRRRGFWSRRDHE